MIKEFFTAFVLMLAIDIVWLSFIAKNIYTESLKPLLRLSSDGKLQALPIPALLVYVALSFGMVLFVLPKAAGSPIQALLWGAVMGAIVYAVYEFTNYSLLANWPLKIVIIDILWGTFLCAVTAFAIAKIF